MKTIVYYFPRTSFMKLFGPVLKAQRELYPDTKAVLFIHRGQGGRSLATRENTAYLSGHFPDVDVIEADDMDGVIADYDIHAVVAVGAGTYLPEPTVARLRENGVRFVVLGHVGDEIIHILKLGNRVFSDWDMITTLSPEWLRILEESAESWLDRAKARRIVKPVGYVELDQTHDFDTQAIRAKYDLPADKKIIYLSTAPLFWNLSRINKLLLERPFRSAAGWPAQWMNTAGRSFLRARGMEQLIGYRRILEEIRRAAPSDRYCIVAKTRAKHNDPSYVAANVDRFIEDDHDAFYPFRTLELMSVCDVYIGFHSASVMESVYLNKFSATVVPIPDELYDIELELITQKRVFHERLWNTPNVCEGFRIYRRDGWDTFRQFLTRLEDIPFDRAGRDRVVRDILGWDDGRCAHRFLKAVMDEAGP